MKRTARSRPRVPESLRLAAGTWLCPAAAPGPGRASPRQALLALRRVRRRCLCVRQTATLPGLKPVLDSSAGSPPHQRREGTRGPAVHSDLVDLRSTPISAQNATRRTDSATCLDRSWSPWICDPLALSRAGSLANRLPSPLRGVLAHERPAARPCLPRRGNGSREVCSAGSCIALLARCPWLSEEEFTNGDVMIAVDPHKASNTAAVLDPGDEDGGRGGPLRQQPGGL
jgi:hypothetical protein